MWGAGSWGHTWDNRAAVSTSGEDEVHRAQESPGRDENQAGRPESRPTPAPAEDEVPVSVGLARHPRVTVAVGGTGWGGADDRSGLAEELQEAALAVGLVILLLEGALVKLLEAEGAHEMLRVELLGHGGDAAAGDGLLAARAQRAAALVVMHLTVRLPVVLKEAAIDKGREAFLPDRRGQRLRSCPGCCSKDCHPCKDPSAHHFL